MRLVWIVGLALAAGCTTTTTAQLHPAPNTCESINDFWRPSNNVTVCWDAEGKPIGATPGRGATTVVPAVVPPVIIRK